jgi:hypothetical protein
MARPLPSVVVNPVEPSIVPRDVFVDVAEAVAEDDVREKAIESREREPWLTTLLLPWPLLLAGEEGVVDTGEESSPLLPLLLLRLLLGAGVSCGERTAFISITPADTNAEPVSEPEPDTSPEVARTPALPPAEATAAICAANCGAVDVVGSGSSDDGSGADSVGTRRPRRSLAATPTGDVGLAAA